MLGWVPFVQVAFKRHEVDYVRSSLLIIMHVGSIATPFFKSKIFNGEECREMIGLKIKYFDRQI